MNTASLIIVALIVIAGCFFLVGYVSKIENRKNVLRYIPLILIILLVGSILVYVKIKEKQQINELEKVSQKLDVYDQYSDELLTSDTAMIDNGSNKNYDSVVTVLTNYSKKVEDIKKKADASKELIGNTSNIPDSLNVINKKLENLNRKINMVEAAHWEDKGFNYLLEKNVDDAIMAFMKSEDNYNGYNMVYEIGKYLRKNRQELQNPDSRTWEAAYNDIYYKYSWKMPVDTRQKIKEAGNIREQAQ